MPRDDEFSQGERGSRPDQAKPDKTDRADRANSPHRSDRPNDRPNDRPSDRSGATPSDRVNRPERPSYRPDSRPSSGSAPRSGAGFGARPSFRPDGAKFGDSPDRSSGKFGDRPDSRSAGRPSGGFGDRPDRADRSERPSDRSGARLSDRVDSRPSSDRPDSRPSSGSAPRSGAGFGARPSFRPDGAKFGDKPDFRRPSGSGGAGAFGDRPKQSLSEEIIGIDEEILRTLVRRSALIGKLRKGKSHAATPGTIKSEKQIRNAWEAQAIRLGGGTRLSRQLYALIQDLNIVAAQGEDFAPFNLSPARQPVEIDSPGPTSVLVAQLWLALAANAAAPTALHNVPRSAAVIELVRAFEQAGVKMQWQGNALVLEGESSPDYYNKAIFVGDDLLTFYLFVFLGVASHGKLRFTGGPALKDLDLSWLARFLPALGARMAWTVPGTKGLPVTLECSGMFPDELSIPADFPLPAAMALLLGGLTSRHKINISIAELPAQVQGQIMDLARRVFKYLPELGQALDKSIVFNGYTFSELDFPASFEVPFDPLLCAPILALPIFTGGHVALSGRWTNLRQFTELTSLFSAFGLEVETTESSISSALRPNSTWPAALDVEQLSPDLHPLFWVLNARLCHRAKAAISIKDYPKGADLLLAADFLEQIGFCLEKIEKALIISPMPAEDFKLVASKSYGWPCPGAMWGIALSLAAFMHSNLKMSNPDCVSQLLPSYWKFYNKLPNAKLKFVDEANTDDANDLSGEAPPTRKRIKTNIVIEPNLLEDDEAEE